MTLIASSGCRCAVIEKKYEPLAGVQAPRAFVGAESAITGQALEGDPDVVVRALLPADFGFDFAVNTMTYAPGAALSQVEVHVMEHGLLMLDGGGIYKLAEDWYQVTAGDFIWMGPFCPQWFAAVGKGPAKYLIYKDFNRVPVL
jgi:(S)-ureidoglycine aminohydrolase